MEDWEKKLSLLAGIGRELNQRNITWALGASMLLCLKGITDVCHDIDLMIAEEDAESVKEVLMSFGSLKPPNPAAQYKTKCFLEFVAEGIDIDVIAGFTIVNGGKEYYFPLEKGSIHDYKEINGVPIPLQSVREWRKYYELMGRTQKVAMIDLKDTTNR